VKGCYMIDKDKLYGSFLGLAIGDAVGTTVEFCDRDTFEPVSDMVGKGPFNLPAGYFTDDTSMALCLAENIIAHGKVEETDLLQRFSDWFYKGTNSSTGYCFDIGHNTYVAILNWKISGSVVNNSNSRYSGNGSIMRLAPVAIKHHNNPDQAYFDAVIQSKTTHASDECIESCMLLTNILLNAFTATTKDQVFNTHVVVTLESVKNIMNTLDVSRDEVSSSGYVIDTLHAALWSFRHTNNFKDAILLATNLGGDADTVAAVTGQIAGAFYGMKNIPIEWLEKLYQKDRFIELVNKLTSE